MVFIRVAVALMRAVPRVRCGSGINTNEVQLAADEWVQ